MNQFYFVLTSFQNYTIFLSMELTSNATTEDFVGPTNQFLSINKRLFDAKMLDSIGVPLCDSCHKSCTIDMQISWLSIIPNVIVGL